MCDPSFNKPWSRYYTLWRHQGPPNDILPRALQNLSAVMQTLNVRPKKRIFDRIDLINYRTQRCLEKIGMHTCCDYIFQLTKTCYKSQKIVIYIIIQSERAIC